MSIEVNSFIDLGLKIDETNNNPKNILLLGNTKGFFGSCSEDKNIFTNACGDEETIKNNYFWLENEYNVCNSNLYIIGDTDVCNYYHHIISDMASMMGKKPKYKYMDINICAKKKGISEEKEIEKYYVNILKEQRGKRMKFDKIIMNPPYDGNLHLKILEQAISLLKDDGVCINLSPIRWLQDPLAKYKKNSDWYKFKEVRDRIENIAEIPMEDACDMFNAGIGFDLGIYKITNKLQNNIEFLVNSNSIVDKVVNRISQTIKDVTDVDKIDGWRVRYSNLRPMSKFNAKSSWVIVSYKYYLTHMKLDYIYKDGYAGDIHWCNDRVGGGGGASKYKVGDPIPYSIQFDTEYEARNFVNSTKTAFYMYYFGAIKVSDPVPSAYLPFMGDCINPRTGLKGYEGEWTDKDFYEYFGITEQEQKEIEETMKPYM